MKIIVAHPGKQHSYQLASALKKAGMLHSYVTEVYDKDSSWMMRLVKMVLNSKNLKRARTHHNPDLDDSEVVQFCEIGGFLELLSIRVDPSMTLYRKFSEKLTDQFGIKLAKYAIRENVDMVICYDADSTTCFRYLKEHAPHIKRVLDVSIASRPYMKTLFVNNMEITGDKSIKNENSYLWKNDLDRFYSEIRDADYFLSASDFVTDSLIYCDVKREQIFKIPYGANLSSSLEINEVKKNEPLKVLFVGQTNARKGLPLLLDCMSTLPTDKYRLTVAGGVNRKKSYIMKHLNDVNIQFTGFILRDQLQHLYEESHIFVLPSIAEGMAMVGIEAMSCGLPIICTYNSGLSDLVVEGETGFVIPSNDPTALKEKLEWFFNHKNLIKSMGERAREVSKGYTWEHYQKNVVDAIRNMV